MFLTLNQQESYLFLQKREFRYLFTFPKQTAKFIYHDLLLLEVNAQRCQIWLTLGLCFYMELNKNVGKPGLKLILSRQRNTMPLNVHAL